jgi:hypothetical protein
VKAMKITTEQKKILENYINDLGQILSSDDINDLLLEIDDAIVGTFDVDGNPNEDGIKLQNIYDDIYANN